MVGNYWCGGETRLSQIRNWAPHVVPRDADGVLSGSVRICQDDDWRSCGQPQPNHYVTGGVDLGPAHSTRCMPAEPTSIRLLRRFLRRRLSELSEQRVSFPAK